MNDNTELLTDVEHEHELNIAAAETELRGHVQNAETAIRQAGVVLNDLMRGNAWHVEYAEGLDGADAEHEIEAAWRAIRNLQRIVDKLSPEGDR
jgi:hypothetical protein